MCTRLVELPLSVLQLIQIQIHGHIEFYLIFFLLQFGVEDFETVRKSDLVKGQIKYQPTQKVCETYYRLKSHKNGKIPFAINKLGFNPGLLVERYLAKLDPNQDLLFQVPLAMDGQLFVDGNKKDEPVWFKDMLLPGSIDQVLTELASIAGLKKFLTVQDFKNARELYKQNPFFMNKTLKIKQKDAVAESKFLNLGNFWFQNSKL